MKPEPFILSKKCDHGEVAYSFWTHGSVGDYVIKSDERLYSSYGFAYNNSEYFVIDPEASISNGGASTSYVACFTPASVNDTDVLNNLTFFHPREAFYPTALNQTMGLTQYPDVSQTPHSLAVNDELTLKVTAIGIDSVAGRPLREQFLNRQAHLVNATASKVDSMVKLGSNTLFIYAYQYYPSFAEGMHDSVLKLDLLGHVDPMALRMMSLLTGIDIRTIPMNDARVLSLFSTPKELGLKRNPLNFKTGAIALPEFGTNFVQGLLEEANAHSFNDLLIISGLSHGTNVWNDNAEALIKDKVTTLQGVIGCRDDIMMARAEVLIVTAQTGVDSGLISDKIIPFTLILILISSFITPILLKVLYKDEMTAALPDGARNPNPLPVAGGDVSATGENTNPNSDNTPLSNK